MVSKTECLIPASMSPGYTDPIKIKDVLQKISASPTKGVSFDTELFEKYVVGGNCSAHYLTFIRD